MGSLSGILQRPFVAAATAVAVSSVSVEIPERFTGHNKSGSSASEPNVSSVLASARECELSSWVSHVADSRLAPCLSLVNRARVPVPAVSFPNANGFASGMLCGSGASSRMLVDSYRSAELMKASKPTTVSYSIPSATPDVLYRWHLPEPNAVDITMNADCSLIKSRTVVVLLGWLGAKQKHMKRYAEIYTSMGYHAITFTFPMSEILSYQMGGKAEQHLDLLVDHLADWLEQEHGKNLVFHTFSNTGWLTYGAILEKFKTHDVSLTSKIKGCIVDSAPVAAPDPKVFASGFSAALLKKNSVATKGYPEKQDFNISISTSIAREPKPAVSETALLLILEKFFEVILNLPTVNRRLSDVLGLLSSSQPECPQLYIYSSADRVIPAGSVETFIEEQRRAGHLVKACNFVSTPHVDHFRNNPELYTSQLTQFLEYCVLTSCK